MATGKTVFELYENGKLIGEGTADEIADKTFFSKIAVYRAAQNGHKLGGRYEIRDEGKSVYYKTKEEKQMYAVIEDGAVIKKGLASQIAEWADVDKKRVYQAQGCGYKLKGKYTIKHVDEVDL